MIRPAPPKGHSIDARSARPAASQRYGPAVGEPPLMVDPRRWGSLIGVAGAMVFIASYSPVFGPVVSTVAWVAGLAGVAAVLFAHYIRPVSLGPLARPRPLALAVYCGCVLGELALISVGSRALVAAGYSQLRPALIAAVVGLHFIPFAWAFQERMFLHLGGVVALIGVTGLGVGALGVPQAAHASAVAAGLAMLTILALYAQGRFAPNALERTLGW